jgi:hypothetical protein
MLTILSLLPKIRGVFSLSAAAALLACAWTAVLGQSATSAERRSHVIGLLEKPLSDPPPNGSTDLAVVVRDILFNARTYGGIVAVNTENCTDHKISYRRTKGETSFKGALDAVVAAAPKYRWTLSDEGAINVLPAGSLPEFLNTDIPYFDWDVNKPMYTALAYLNDTHEVRKRRLELNITQVGFGGLYALREGDGLEKPGDWRRVEHVSLLSTLNTIAESYGNGVWVYSECRRADSITIQLTDLVR